MVIAGQSVYLSVCTCLSFLSLRISPYLSARRPGLLLIINYFSVNRRRLDAAESRDFPAQIRVRPVSPTHTHGLTDVSVYVWSSRYDLASCGGVTSQPGTVG